MQKIHPIQRRLGNFVNIDCTYERIPIKPKY